jgi:hypothetical protein
VEEDQRYDAFVQEIFGVDPVRTKEQQRPHLCTDDRMMRLMVTIPEDSDSDPHQRLPWPPIAG